MGCSSALGPFAMIYLRIIKGIMKYCPFSASMSLAVSWSMYFVDESEGTLRWGLSLGATNALIQVQALDSSNKFYGGFSL